MKANDNEILTIAGRRVEVRLCEKGPCDKCCFFSHDCGCPYDMPCFPYWGPGYFAYFVPAKESVDRWVVTNAFLKCDRAGKIVSEMYGDRINNSRNRDKYLAFLQQVNLDDRFGELAGILQKYGAMPALKEQPVSDLEAEIERYESEIHGFESSSRADCLNIARHFAEWERKRTLDKVVEWMKANLTYTHPRKGVETCMVNIPAFLDTMNEENT